MNVHQKLAAIKEKIRRLASNLEDLRSDNLKLVKDNQDLIKIIKRKDAEIQHLKKQLADCEDKLENKLFEKTVGNEEK